ncbi:AraC family transcriptional regulator [Alteromonas sediminis]|uniref:AraC family transcriptional regulator n=1 Tax=Alteromonas sediminis TaxID=2259342 RepID=A0A3N5Y066_9ALTE|nr:AraC family transcriptional regulator [Alteromonas sediminis]RPJ66997.1 AraC family transcriptional regulator [Alteromonas sediminis]
MPLSVPTFYIAQLNQLLIEQGFDLRALLRKKNASLDALQRPSATLSLKAFDELLTDIATQTGQPHLGLLLGKRLQVSHHGPFGLAMANSENVFDVINLVSEFLSVRLPFLSLSAEHTKHNVIVTLSSLHQSGFAHQFVIDALAMAFLNIQNALFSKTKTQPIKRILFDYPLPETMNLQKYFEGIAYTDSHPFCGMILDKEACRTQLEHYDPVGLQYAKEMCAREITALKGALTTSEKVRALFESEATLPSLEKIASLLCVSKRTLHRQLENENTSFKLLRESWLKSKAANYLLVKNLSVEQTADLLGYTDSANFRRAFKRWFHISPSKFAAQNTL